MFKKEYLLIFIVIGLTLAYAVFSLLVFITRGKSPVFLRNKLAMAVAIIAFSSIMSFAPPAFTQEVTPAPTPIAVPTALYGTMPPTPEPTAVPTTLPEATETPVILPVYGILTPEPTITALYAVMTPNPVLLGDVNSNGAVDIVDALLIAQYYVGLNPQNFDIAAADVNASGSVDIVDALLVSQKYVGIIDKFPGEK